MKNRYFDLNTYLRDIFGCRVQKISLDAGLTCPNRDGSISTGGCIYCNSRGSGTGAFKKGMSITEQIMKGKEFLSKRYKAKKFIAYFQSFSNTYGPYEKLRGLYEEALAIDDIVGLSIGTRPDCIDESILTLLEGYTKDYLVWIEYGLQSIHERTLTFINRGHDVNCFKSLLRQRLLLQWRLTESRFICSMLSRVQEWESYTRRASIDVLNRRNMQTLFVISLNSFPLIWSSSASQEIPILLN